MDSQHSGCTNLSLDKSEFGRRLRSLREERDMTQKDVSEATGFPVSSLSYAEKGANSISSLVKFANLARLYGTTIDELLGNAPIEIDTQLDRAFRAIPASRRDEVRKIVLAYIEDI